MFASAQLLARAVNACVSHYEDFERSNTAPAIKELTLLQHFKHDTCLVFTNCDPNQIAPPRICAEGASIVRFDILPSTMSISGVPAVAVCGGFAREVFLPKT